MEWDWSDVDRCTREMHQVRRDSATCKELQKMAIQPPFSRQGLRDLGITGIEFAAFSTAHPSGLAVDLTSLRSPEQTTKSGYIFQVDHGGYFAELNISQPLPFADASVDWVYAEHIIEHVVPHIAVKWLTEVARILSPNGWLRLSTPDLARYVEGYLNVSDFYSGHRQRMVNVLAPAPRMPQRRAFMLNQIFYFFGHRWIYDFDELRYVLGSAGFNLDTVRQRSFREGERADIALLDQAVRNDESIYIEARSPAHRVESNKSKEPK